MTFDLNLSTVLSMIAAAAVAYISLRIDASLSRFQVNMEKIISDKLASYVQHVYFNQYSQGHASEHVHLVERITENTVRLSAFEKESRDSRNLLRSDIIAHTLKLDRHDDHIKNHDERIKDLENRE
jgi:hypothetical protein